MKFIKTEQVKKVIAVLRDDKTRLQFGALLIVFGLVLFGVYFPKTHVQNPTDAVHQAGGSGSAQVAGTNIDASNAAKGSYPRTHAGAPEPGQHMAAVPGSDPAACAAGTGSGKTMAPNGMSGTIDVTLPAGCTTSPNYELHTSDGHEVQWTPLFGAFTFKDGTSYEQRGATGYAVTNLQFNADGSKGSSIRYGVSAKPDAKPGTYENALYITDSTHKDGGYKVILRITVKK